jgi:hypothetical protein
MTSLKLFFLAESLMKVVTKFTLDRLQKHDDKISDAMDKANERAKRAFELADFIKRDAEHALTCKILKCQQRQSDIETHFANVLDRGIK